MEDAVQGFTHKIPSLLFVCTGNTCRSVMAEAMARRRFGTSILVGSAGLRPQKPEDAKNAVDTLKAEFGLDVSGHIPRDVRTLDLDAFEYVVAMDKDVAKQLKAISTRKVIIWNIGDPYGDDLDEYKRRGLEIMQHVAKLSLAKKSGRMT